MKLILLRHGESQWNLENRFTGWKDINLTPNGIKEAQWSADKILNENLSINSIHTSILVRAQHTAEIVAKTINFPIESIIKDWRLNERHYGALQGLNKSETAKKYGEEQVLIWRRSYNISPPLLKDNDTRHLKQISKFKKIKEILPKGESLEDVLKRLLPFWEMYFNKIKFSNNTHLIVAHSNSLRAIIKILDLLSNDEIIKVNIPTGVPLIYTFDKNGIIVDKKYLIGTKELEKKQKKILNQGKIK